jgi:hypothetical protein
MGAGAAVASWKMERRERRVMNWSILVEWWEMIDK